MKWIIWMPPSVNVSVEFGRDEAVQVLLAVRVLTQTGARL
jgi:hypothetical protein